MGKRHLFVFALALLFSLTASADIETIEGIFAWANGGVTCYQLSSVPKVKYSEDDGVIYANLYLDDATDPTLSIKLEDDNDLRITFGTYIYVSLNAYGYSTFSFDKPVRFTYDVGVYTLEVNNDNTLTFYERIESVAPYTGLLLKGTPNAKVPLRIMESGLELNNNQLEATTIAGNKLAEKNSNETYYVLSKNKFVRYTGSSFSPNKAYFQLTNSGIKEFSIDPTDTETSIQSADDIKVSKVGKYISGGHLIIVKDGKKYDVNGTLIK